MSQTKDTLSGVDTHLANIEVKLAEVSEEGEFEGYAAVFNNVDRAYDRLVKGAFDETLKEKKPNQIKMLYQHNHTKPIGVFTEFKVDSKGLKVKGRINVNTPLGQEVHSNMKEGVLDSMSIGYRAQDFEYKEYKGALIRELKKVDLWEVSVVTFPANPKAGIRSVKRNSGPSVPLELRVLERMANYIKENINV